MNSFKMKLLNFFRGRYGLDKLNYFLIICAFICSFISMFTRQAWLVILMYVLLIIYLLRSFSKNIVARQRENYLFLEKTKGIRRHFIVIKKNIKDKNYHYYLCPSCKQMVRIPRGKGKVEIHCPSCGKSFTKKS